VGRGERRGRRREGGERRGERREERGERREERGERTARKELLSATGGRMEFRNNGDGIGGRRATLYGIPAVTGFIFDYHKR
jgi:hypothetical protein